MPKPKPKPTYPRDPSVKAVRLDLTPEDHARLRVRAAEAGMQMSRYARQIVVNALNSRGEKIPRKSTG